VLELIKCDTLFDNGNFMKSSQLYQLCDVIVHVDTI